MSLAIGKSLRSAIGQPTGDGIQEADHRLNISVVFTSVTATLLAFRASGNLGRSLDGRVTLVAPQVVPHPPPLETPPVPIEFNEKRFRLIADQSPLETHVQMCLCRGRFEGLKAALRPGASVILGGRKRWDWPTHEERLARKLRRAGIEVIFKEAG